jgi:hypothetical protein
MANIRTLAIVHWVTRLAAAGILVMGALPKFTGNAGALAAKLPGGSTSVLLIGLAESAAIVLLMVPKMTLIGAGLASLIMLGAVVSHVAGPVGMEGDFQGMFFMALVALVMSAASFVIAWRRCQPASPGASAV